MSVSMLLNAANVVTAAERCQAIDEKTGRIPIQFLLSRSNDLDDAVKDQLQQLAASSPSISILAERADHPDLVGADHVMTDLPDASLPQQQQQGQEQQQQQQQQQAVEEEELDEDEDDEDDEHEDAQRRISTETNLGSIPDDMPDHSDFERDSENEEEEALKDIDLETRSRPDRKMMAVDRKDKRNQTLTRKAIRKHTGGGKKGNKKENKGAMESSSAGIMDGVQMSVDGSTSTNSNTPRRRWKEWEDELLIQVVSEHGPTRWNSLARHFPGRNGRQVRLRWMNHLQPSLDKRPWRAEEDAVLLEAHKALGNKWALISMRLGGRTDNSVKNRYKSIVRRSIREAKAARKQE